MAAATSTTSTSTITRILHKDKENKEAKENKETKQDRQKHVVSLVRIPSDVKVNNIWPTITGEAIFADAEGNCYWIGEQSLYHYNNIDLLDKIYAFLMPLGKVVNIAENKFTVEIDNDMYMNICAGNVKILNTRDDVEIFCNKMIMVNFETLSDHTRHLEQIITGRYCLRTRFTNECDVDLMWNKLKQYREAEMKRELEHQAMIDAGPVMAVEFFRDRKFRDLAINYLEVLKATGFMAINDAFHGKEIKVEYLILSRLENIRESIKTPSSGEFKITSIGLRSGDYSNRGFDYACIGIYSSCNNFLYLDGTRLHVSFITDDNLHNYDIIRRFPKPPVTWMKEYDSFYKRSVALSIEDLECALDKSS